MARRFATLGVVAVAAAAMMGEAALAEQESVTPESLGIYRSSTERDPLSERYQDDAQLRVFDQDVTVSVQPPSIAERDYEGNERVRLPR